MKRHWNSYPHYRTFLAWVQIPVEPYILQDISGVVFTVFLNVFSFHQSPSLCYQQNAWNGQISAQKIPAKLASPTSYSWKQCLMKLCMSLQVMKIMLVMEFMLVNQFMHSIQVMSSEWNRFIYWLMIQICFLEQLEKISGIKCSTTIILHQKEKQLFNMAEMFPG